MRLGKIWLAIFAVAFHAIAWAGPGADPLLRAHAHNDYEHARPLHDALSHGFCNVEADIYLRPEGLLVAHDLRDVRPDRTLEVLYLAPLKSIVDRNGGWVLKQGTPFTLLIDIKSEAESTYAALHKILANYEGMLSTTRNGVYRPGPVTIVISGNRPIDTMTRQPLRFAGIDGRPTDLSSPEARPADLMPWISGRWGESFTWKGEGEMPTVERDRLKAMVDQAHKRGSRLGSGQPRKRKPCGRNSRPPMST